MVLLEIAISRPYLESAERTGEDRGNQEAGSSAGEDPSRRDKTNLFSHRDFPISSENLHTERIWREIRIDFEGGTREDCSGGDPVKSTDDAGLNNSCIHYTEHVPCLGVGYMMHHIVQVKRKAK